MKLEYLSQNGKFNFLCIGNHIHESSDEAEACSNQMAQRIGANWRRKAGIPIASEIK